MGDQRIEGAPALGLVEPRDRRRIGRIRTQPVHRLGRKSDQATFRQTARRRRQCSFAGRQNLRFRAHMDGN